MYARGGMNATLMRGFLGIAYELGRGSMSGAGVLTQGRYLGWEWSVGGRPHSSISVRVEEDGVLLMCRHRGTGGAADHFAGAQSSTVPANTSPAGRVTGWPTHPPVRLTGTGFSVRPINSEKR